MKEKSLTFEENLANLEKITILLEQGDLSLHDALVQFEEGVRLAEACFDDLKKYRMRAQELAEQLESCFNEAGEVSDG